MNSPSRTAVPLAIEVRGLGAKLAELKAKRDAQRRKQTFSAIRDQLNDTLGAFARGMESRRAFIGSKTDIQVPGGLLDARREVSTLDACRREFDKDPMYIVERFRTRDLDARCLRIAKWLNDSLRESWNNYTVGKKIPKLEIGLLDMFARLPAARQQATGLKEAWGELKKLEEGLPVTSADIGRFDRRVAQVRKLWVELGSELPAEVEKFIRSVASDDGAPLEDFTDGIRDWLATKKWLVGFRIRVKGQFTGYPTRWSEND